MGLLSTQTYGPMAAIMAAGMVPPLAMGLATMVARRKFDKSAAGRWQSRSGIGTVLHSEGNSVLLLVIRCVCYRAVSWVVALTGAISMAIGAKLMAPHGGLFVR